MQSSLSAIIGYLHRGLRPNQHSRIRKSNKSLAVETFETRVLLTAPTGISLDDNHIPENAGPNAIVGTLSAIDPTNSGPYTFLLPTSSFSDNRLFNIDPVAKTLRANNSLTFANGLGEPSVYNVTIRVTNSLNEFTDAVFTIFVTNVDEAAPTFTSGVTVSVNENVAANTVVYTAVATDTDFNAPATANSIIYGFGGGIDDNDFNINPSTGAVTIKASPDRETRSSYNFTVKATDAANNFSTRAVSLTVNNLDEVAPGFTSAATASVSENVAANSIVHTAVATDTDFNAPATASSITYGFGGGIDDNAFNINPSTGVVTIKASPDRETKSSYNFTVKATDAANNFSTRAVSLTVNNLDEIAPGFTSATTASVSENVAPNTVVYTAVATDTDFNAPATANSVTYAFGGGTDDGAFDINTSNGEVTIKASPNYELKDSYTFIVTATDASGNLSARTVNLTIDDVNEATFASNAFFNKNANAERNTSAGLAATGQRSMIRNIEVVFNGDVVISNGAVSNGSFALTKLGTSPSTIGVTVVSSTIAAGKTTVVLGFEPLTLTTGGSLADGNYSLLVDYGALDIDGDGSGTVGGTKTVNFHRLFGDSDGDRDVDASDYKNYVAGVRGAAKWISIFDSNNNNLLVSGSVQDNDDKIAFFANYGRGI